jgi:hypothetical protein
MGLARGHASSRRIVGLRGSCTKNPRTEPGSHLLKPHAFLTRVLLRHNQSFLEQGAGWLCRKMQAEGERQLPRVQGGLGSSEGQDRAGQPRSGLQSGADLFGNNRNDGANFDLILK